MLLALPPPATPRSFFFFLKDETLEDFLIAVLHEIELVCVHYSRAPVTRCPVHDVARFWVHAGATLEHRVHSF